MKKVSNLLSALAIVLVTFSSCGSSKNEYPASAAQGFMSSCQEASGGNQATCSCLLEKIKEKYTFEEFTAVDNKIKTGGEVPAEFSQFIDQAKTECNK